MAVQKHPPLGRVIEALQEIDCRALARSTRAHKGNCCPRLDHKIEVLKYSDACTHGIKELHMFEGDFALDAVEPRAVLLVGVDFWRAVNCVEYVIEGRLALRFITKPLCTSGHIASGS